MDILEYEAQFLTVCLEIFESNRPKYFHEDERQLFINYLNRTPTDQYYVLKDSERIVACGGIYEDDIKVAGLAWGMVHQDFHGQGFGREFTKYRIQKMKDVFPDHRYKIDTSQHTSGFYKKMGFETSEIIKDGFGPGLDKVIMWLNPS